MGVGVSMSGGVYGPHKLRDGGGMLGDGVRFEVAWLAATRDLMQSLSGRGVGVSYSCG